jgi:hypothetical protein
METLNLEAGKPTVEEARRRLEDGLATARARGVRFMKLIHGYGSTGKGGKIRSALPKTLRRLMNTGLVAEFVDGERWRRGDATTDALLRKHPALRDDADLDRGNKGITIVALANTPRATPKTQEDPGPVRPARTGTPSAEEATGLLCSEPEVLYDLYSTPEAIRRHRPEE